jgi:hypothetical protein
MITINIEDIDYQITSKPTIEEWQSLMKYDFNEYSQWTAIIHTLTGAPIDQLDNMDWQQKHLAVVMVAHALTERVEVPLPDFNELEFGVWVDAEYYFAMGLEKSLHLIVDRVGHTTTDAQEAMYVIETYMTWRDSIYRQYSALFSYEDPDIEDMAKTNKQTATEVAKGWYKILVDLASDDVLKIDAVTKLNIKEALNFMALRKEKQTAELNRQKQKQRQQIQNQRR